MPNQVWFYITQIARNKKPYAKASCNVTWWFFRLKGGGPLQMTPPLGVHSSGRVGQHCRDPCKLYEGSGQRKGSP